MLGSALVSLLELSHLIPTITIIISALQLVLGGGGEGGRWEGNQVK